MERGRATRQPQPSGPPHCLITQKRREVWRRPEVRPPRFVPMEQRPRRCSTGLGGPAGADAAERGAGRELHLLASWRSGRGHPPADRAARGGRRGDRPWPSRRRTRCRRSGARTRDRREESRQTSTAHYLRTSRRAPRPHARCTSSTRTRRPTPTSMPPPHSRSRPTTFSHESYRAEARRMAGAILTAGAILDRETTTVAGRLVLVAGPWAIADRIVSHSSLARCNLDVLAATTGDPRWPRLLADSYALLRRLIDGRLPPTGRARRRGTPRPVASPDDRQGAAATGSTPPASRPPRRLRQGRRPR